MAYMKDSTGKRLDTIAVPEKSALGIDTLVVVGNSIAEGAGTQPGFSLATLTAQALGMNEENYAVSGSVVQSAPELRGLYSRALTKLYPPAAAPLGTVACAYLIFTGINDLYGGPQFGDGYRIVEAIVRAAVHRFRAVATIAGNATSVVYTPATGSGLPGAWLSVTSSQYFSGATPTQATPNPIGAVRQTVTDGNTYAFTAPAWWPAGRTLEVWGHNIGSLTSFNGGAVHSWTKTGGASGSYDSRNRTNTGLIMPWHYDVPNVNAGDVVTVTISAMTVNGDYVTNFQCPSDDAPPVVVAGVYKNPSYGTGTHNPTDADVDTVNTLLATIPAAFPDGRVVFVDTDAIMSKDTALFATESPPVHPNTDGHRKLAVEGLIPAFQALSPSLSVRAAARRQPDAKQSVRVIRNYDMHDSIGIGTLVAGAASIASRSITSTDSLVFLTPIGAGAGSLSRGTLVATSAGTAGTCAVASTDAADVRQFQWWVINPSRVI